MMSGSITDGIAVKVALMPSIVKPEVRIDEPILLTFPLDDPEPARTG